MVLTSTCSFNALPPTATSSSTAVPQHLPSIRLAKKTSWKNQCVLAMTCAIIGSQAEGIIGDNHSHAMTANQAMVVELKGKRKRWSDKRICPAWQLNSLETIVPEDLPRPSTKRRWESVGDHSRVALPYAPPVKASITTNQGCFSM